MKITVCVKEKGNQNILRGPKLLSGTTFPLSSNPNNIEYKRMQIHMAASVTPRVQGLQTFQPQKFQPIALTPDFSSS